MTLTHLARTLRQRSTEAERLLWSHLRARRLKGYKFRRQMPLGGYVVDFVCWESCLVVELDGGQHLAQQREDQERTEVLNALGFQVVRFWNDQVLRELDAVLTMILEALNNGPSPQPSPAGRGGSTELTG